MPGQSANKPFGKPASTVAGVLPAFPASLERCSNAVIERFEGQRGSTLPLNSELKLEACQSDLE